MDLSTIGIGGVTIVALVIGIVEALKDFGVNGKYSKPAAFVVSFALVGVAMAMSEGMISESAIPYIELLVKSLAFALGATGYYDLYKKRKEREEDG